jgi:hypothetical protein
MKPDRQWPHLALRIVRDEAQTRLIVRELYDMRGNLFQSGFLRGSCPMMARNDLKPIIAAVRAYDDCLFDREFAIK